MKTYSKNILGILLTTMGVVQLAGCNADDQMVASGSGYAQSSEHSYPGKPQAAVDIDYDIQTPFVMDEESQITLVITSRKVADDLQLMVTAVDDQLVISGIQSEYSFGMQQAGQQNRVELGVTPRARGLYYIGINVRLVTGGSSSVRSFAIPVNTATEETNSKLKPAGKITIDPAGERLIIMPSGERPD